MKEHKHNRKILVLHGDRQTGDLLVGRMASLKRKLLKPRSYDDNKSSNHNINNNGPTKKNSKNSNAHKDSVSNPNSNHGHRIELVAPDGPFVWKADPSVHRIPQEESEKFKEEESESAKENNLMRTWWERDGNSYGGLDQSLDMLLSTWENGDGSFEGILAFSRGARLTHLIATLHELSNGRLFRGLRYVIMASGYGNVPLPTNFPPRGKRWDECLPDDPSFFKGDDDGDDNVFPLHIPSMHIMGAKDRLITVEASRALLPSYVDPVVHVHDGGHHVPMRAADCRAILSFIDSIPENTTALKEVANGDGKGYGNENKNGKPTPTPKSKPIVEEPKLILPDEEHAQAQREECESLAMIFPDEFHLISATAPELVGGNFDEDVEYSYAYPITYSIQLKPPQDQLDEDEDMKKLWPVRNIALKVEYTPDYPDAMPKFSLDHDMNLLEFKLSQEKACLDAVREVAESEVGMPCVMSCIYGARDFFEQGGLASSLVGHPHQDQDATIDAGKEHVSDDTPQGGMNGDFDISSSSSSTLKPSSPERIQKCIEDGLQIGYSLLSKNSVDENGIKNEKDQDSSSFMCGKGGSWRYTIGLVGKPSAGKSTFFNAATAFARQRGGDEVNEDGIAIGGASMAPHPFTTIDPNIGYCLVPAPHGSCPESNDCSVATTHGRDSLGRRLLPVTLKDVAGLVPGAYQGRGRGNKFLDDLTDADVLIHVLDSSGTADSEGNVVVVGSDDHDALGSHPINDLGWINNEIIQWVYFNLKAKWDTIARKGRDKLAGMLSGYKQSQAFVWNVLITLEKNMYQKEGRDNALDHLDLWDEGDLYMLVAAFIGARFPVSLAMNKIDIASAKRHCDQIKASLPLHGAHCGTPLSAHEEMGFVRQNIYSALTNTTKKIDDKISPPRGVWDCLQSAIELREPVLAFPVVDMESYQPLPGMNENAISDASLPNAGMISCLKAAGGTAPTLWDSNTSTYSYSSSSEKDQKLRDALVLRQGSTIEDVFSALKGMGALSGEYVRAEAVGHIGDKPNLVKKDDLLGSHNRIVKIMTTRRREWQKKL